MKESMADAKLSLQLVLVEYSNEIPSRDAAIRQRDDPLFCHHKEYI
jgi:hypothetical protein